MAGRIAAGPDSGADGVKDTVVQTLRASGAAVGQLAGGLGTAVVALVLLLLLAVAGVSALVGVGVLVAPFLLRALHALAQMERARLARRGLEVIAPEPPPTRLRPALKDPTTRREVRWLCRHATSGLLLSVSGTLLPFLAFRDGAFPLYWKLIPKDATATSLGFGNAHSWPGALSVTLLGAGWIAIILGLTPPMARLQASPGQRLLAAGPDTDLSLRVAELTATRAAALDAHAAELRRIERALHDGTQNRLVSVTVLLGAARRQMARDPSHVDEILERAQSAAEQGLAELRAVARTILPPVLDDRGLADALAGLAANCAVPCRIDVDAPERCAASVEATAYFVVAEALTNISKHSGAEKAAVRVRARGRHIGLTVCDNGRGGAHEAGGSGLTGIRHRVAAHDGTLRLASPPGGPTTLEVDLPCGS